MKKIISVLFAICIASGAFAQSELAQTREKWNILLNFTQISNPSNDGEKGFNDIVRQRFYDERNMLLSKNQDYDWKDDYGFTCDLLDTVMYSDDSFISLYCYGGYIYSNVRNISNYSFSINYDLEKNKEVLFKDMFTDGCLEVLSDYCIKELVKQKLEYDSAITKDNQMLLECAGPDEKNYRAINPTKNGLLVSFITYSVLNVRSTPVHSRVMVPYSVLNNYIKPDSKISLFIK